MMVKCKNCESDNKKFSSTFYLFICLCGDEIYLCNRCANATNFKRYVCESCQRDEKLKNILDGNL